MAALALMSLLVVAAGLKTGSKVPGPECQAADRDLHILFSTGCNAFQHWQAEVMLNSAYHAHQCGKITRIIVGCDKQKGGRETFATHPAGDSDRLIVTEDLTKSTNPNVAIHVAPSIPEAQEFPWFNKPWSFKHWLDNQESLTERAYVITDPDEFFLEPLSQHGGIMADDVEALRRKPNATPQLLSTLRDRDQERVTDVVQPGLAVAQHYGLGAGYMHSFDTKSICPGGPASPCASVSDEEAYNHYPAGPPYILHKDDFKKVVPDWWSLMKPVYQQGRRGDILADMYAYIFAAMHNKMKHTLLDNYMLSNVDAGGEAWRWIDDIPEMSCHDPQFPAGSPRPTFIHMAGHYKACTKGDTTSYDMEVCHDQEGSTLWNFHKGHVPSQILECDHPLIMPPPDDFFNVQVARGNERGKRGAFMICNLISTINRAALEYKQKFCHAGFNEKKCTRLVTGTGRQKELKNPGNPWSYPLARVDMDCCPDCHA